MHVLLNAHGWVSDRHPPHYDQGRCTWQWSHADRPGLHFMTWSGSPDGRAVPEWREIGSPIVKRSQRSLSGLARQLARVARRRGG